MRTLVTGVAGFVGRHFAAAFATRGVGELHGADHLAPAAVDGDAAFRGSLRSYRCLDVTDAESVAAWIGALVPDRVIHLAAQASGAESIAKPAHTYRVNALGALHVLEGVRLAAPAATVLVIGSADVYGTGVPDQRLTEEAPLRPRNPYAVSKAAQDLLGELYAGAYGLRVVRTRTFSHSGPGQHPRFALPAFAEQLARIEAGLAPPVIAVGNLQGVRDYCDVRDVVQAYDALLERGEPGEAYNVCSGHGYTMGELLNRLIAISGVHASVEVDPARVRARDSDVLVGDPGTLNRRTGWSAAIAIERTLEDLYQDARARVRANTKHGGGDRCES